LHWQQANKFPLKDLVSNGTIQIDTAFKVDEMTLYPTYVKLGTSRYHPDAANKDQVLLNYIG
jgi:hypothetical protein